MSRPGHGAQRATIGSARSSPHSNPENDLLKKLRVYQRSGVPHYWIIDPVAEVLVVYRWTSEGYLLILTTEGSERVRAEPFDAVELSVRDLVALDEAE